MIHILVVEDDEKLNRIVCTYLNDSGFQTKGCLNARDAYDEMYSQLYDLIISEADGSRGLPLKIHSSRDPVIHPLTTATVAVMGVWGIGEKAYSVAFGEERGCIVDNDYLKWYLSDPEGLCKGFGQRNAIVFNAAGVPEKNTLKMLEGLDYPENTRVYLASEMEDEVYGIIC